jgi:hypothetical protein
MTTFNLERTFNHAQNFFTASKLAFEKLLKTVVINNTYN